jgi:hypothetical protein
MCGSCGKRKRTEEALQGPLKFSPCFRQLFKRTVSKDVWHSRANVAFLLLPHFFLASSEGQSLHYQARVLAEIEAPTHTYYKGQSQAILTI